MRKMLLVTGFAAALGLVGVSGAGAVPADITAVKQAATAASPLRQAQYAERRTRHGVVKCYRDLVVGPYRCHYFRDPI
jgi:hypothetical protein